MPGKEGSSNSVLVHIVAAVLWEYQQQHNGALPSSEADAVSLKDLAKQVLPKHDIDPSLLPDDLLE